MLRVGLTGGIGSGKSTVSRIFSTLGIPVYTADTASKQILSRPSVKTLVLQAFPEIISAPSFSNISFTAFTQALGSIVFSKPEKLSTLNNILHPLVIEDCERWFASAKVKSSPYSIVEAAILIESGLYKKMDKIIDVESSISLQIKRTVLRDNCSEEEVKNRLKNQLSPEQRIKHSDFIIYNNEENPLLEEILHIDSVLRTSIY